eukprot:scaffold2760_cov167-Amphora_coffeaeformis.AAC.5
MSTPNDNNLEMQRLRNQVAVVKVLQQLAVTQSDASKAQARAAHAMHAMVEAMQAMAQADAEARMQNTPLILEVLDKVCGSAGLSNHPNIHSN